MAGWLTAPVQLQSSREFECEDLSQDECDYYMQRWHFWYIADYVYALPTIAFFMSSIGIFIIGRFITSQVLGYRRFRGPQTWQKLIALVRYLSYRGFHVKSLRWNSAPIGVLLLGAAGTIYFFCMDLIPQPYYWSSEMYGNSPPLGTRSGWMALACMPFVFATASKSNWITLFTGVSHEKLQVFHRWISYAFFVLALLHTFPFIVYHIRFHDMEEQVKSSLLFYWTGIVALVFQAWLTFASFSTIRNLGYEFFKVTHLFAVVVFVLIFFWHCDYTLTSWDYFIATAAVYVPCFVFPWIRTCFEYGLGQKARITVEENGFTRITIAANFQWKPGQHCFLRFTSLGLQALSSHPFTICSSPMWQGKKSELVFYVRHQGGLTAKLYQLALAQPGVSVPVLVDGPYGGIDLQRYDESDHIVVVAGGSGAGWIIPFVERFLAHKALASDDELGGDLPPDQESGRPLMAAGPLSLRVILATRDTSSREWFLETMSELLSRHTTTHEKPSVTIQVYLTGDAAQAEDAPDRIAKAASTSSTSSDEKITTRKDHGVAVTGKEFRGRPPLPLILRDEAIRISEAGESLGVFVCGPGTMQNDVRNAIADANLNILRGSKSSGAYLHCEHFSWA